MKRIAIFILLIAMFSSLVACTPTPNKPNNPNVPATPNNPYQPNEPDEPEPDDNDGIIITFAAGQGEFANGNNSRKVKADENGKVVLSHVPHRDGYAFAGWYDGEKEFDPEAKYTKNQTFTAKYASGAEDKVYTALFSESSKVTIDIYMSDAEWKKLNQDYKDFEAKGSKSPIYRLADNVVIGINDGNDFLYYYYEEVGVRLKGNTSRHEFYDGNGFFDNVHFKLSFKQTFDDLEDGYKQDELKVWTDDAKRSERKARTFGGMEKIDIKYNSTADETYVRELYAMKLFRDNGIYAPNVTLCALTALEKDSTYRNLGVYRIHEPVDEAFISRRLNESKVGDLWKCTYTRVGPADLTNYDLDKRVGVEDELKGKFYSYDKKTNKKKDKTTGLRDFSSIKNFIEAINGNNPDFEQLIDVDYFVKFEAINYILGNPDCIRNHYNNYYLYFRADGKAIIIPYDYDRCLGITYEWNPTGSANMKLAPFTRTTTDVSQNNPLYKNLIVKGAPYGEGSALMRYRQNLINMSVSQALNVNTFDAYKNNYKAMYAAYTATALSTNGWAFDTTDTGNVSYATYMQTKLKTLNDNIDNYRA